MKKNSKTKKRTRTPSEESGKGTKTSTMEEMNGTIGVLHALVSKKRASGVIALSAERAKDNDRDFGVLTGGFPAVLLNAQAMERMGVGLTDLVYITQNKETPTELVAVAVAVPSQFTLRDCLFSSLHIVVLLIMTSDDDLMCNMMYRCGI